MGGEGGRHVTVLNDCHGRTRAPSREERPTDGSFDITSLFVIALHCLLVRRNSAVCNCERRSFGNWFVKFKSEIEFDVDMSFIVQSSA